MIRTAVAVKPKLKRCKECGSQYEKRTMAHVYCSPPCLFAAKQKADAKKARADYKKRKEVLKTRSDYIKEAQTAFNAYVRARDAGQPCICCGLPLALDAIGGGYDCGHYRSVGSAPHLRFDERNAHGQRKQCNRYGAGRAVDYRIGLIKRIGLAEVEALEAKQDGGKWSTEELVAIRAEYKKKLKQLQEQQKEHPAVL